ncbi:ABC transporter permease [Pollutimonas harenae]|uniref:FtsX-like permease family protein n=1 Tax=Pollutimonas harenae TaxID=657015 RepID=A0A853H7Z4_9BURK|nr:FtsX-like permease family protein [Pollutimonas harenae]NYT86613.1 FtsX-like permease family protein [Pollutimonas harenae]TEA69649.1 FtsX-like permease family protein [Pollutimonas harenae]
MHSGLVSYMRLGVKALRRDWRSGELRLLLLALLIAVAAVTSVGFLADRVGRALERDSAQMLGGDLALRADEPIPADFITQASDHALSTAQTLQFPSMASGGDRAQLVSLKAVSPTYPLRGALRLAEMPGGPAVDVAQAPEPGTVWVDPQVLGLLGMTVGDDLQVGDSALKIVRVIAYEPDRGMQFVNVAPRVMMNLEDLPETGLVAPGSRISYHLLVAGDIESVADYQRWLEQNMQRGQRLSTLETNRPEVQRALARAHQFLMLVALLTVMIAAVAIALAARRFGLRHQDGIAVLRCLGASKVQLGWMLWVEFLLLAVGASLLGCAAGYAVHLGLVSVVDAWLQTALPPISLRPALQGIATGFLLLLGFALPPLAALRKVAPARVLRRETGSVARHWPAYLLGGAAFFLLIVWMSGDIWLSTVVAGGFALALLVFIGLAYALVGVLGLFRQRSMGHPALRFALAGMARRKNLTVAQLCSLSMGLTILLLLAITRTDLLQGWQRTLPADAPNTFLINIQPDQREAVAQRLRSAGVETVVMSPMVRGRLLAINQQAVDSSNYDNPRAKRMADREFNLSYAETMPSSNVIIAGRWLHTDSLEVSLETGLAETLGIKLNDSLTFDVAGRPIKVRVSSLREVDWDSFQANFFAMMSPAALADAPTTFITSLYVAPTMQPFVQNLIKEFPNLTVFDVGSILGQIQHVLDQVIQAVQLLFLFTVAAGGLVLGAALFSTRDERMHEVAVLRALGASGRQLADALRLELLVLGGLAGLLAAFAAVAIAWLLARQVFEFSLDLSLWPWLAGVLAGALTALVGGKFALAGVLKTPPLVSLRELA